MHYIALDHTSKGTRIISIRLWQLNGLDLEVYSTGLVPLLEQKLVLEERSAMIVQQRKGKN